MWVVLIVVESALVPSQTMCSEGDPEGHVRKQCYVKLKLVLS